MAGVAMEEGGGHVIAWNMTELSKLAKSCGEQVINPRLWEGEDV
jgi:hypothetical protein